MRGRFGPLTPPALLLALFAVLAATGTAQAHRLDAQAFLLPGHKVQIESWFGDGTLPRGAKVEVLRGDGQPLTEGQLDDKGVFVFSFEKPEPLTVVVSAGAGHRKELALSEADLTRSVSEEPKAATSATGPESTSVPHLPLADRNSQVTLKDALVGVSFLLGLAAFVLSLRNARRLRRLEGKAP